MIFRILSATGNPKEPEFSDEQMLVAAEIRG